MKLTDALCDICIPRTWNFDKKDDYGDIIEPALCPVPIITEEKIIESVAVREQKPFDTMDEALKLSFTEKNKINCLE